jgi:transposase
MQRVQMVALAVGGRSAKQIVELLGCARSQVYEVVGRFLKGGRVGLLDRRNGNGRRLADPAFEATVRELLRSSPQDFGYPRPTWTRELLIRVAEERTGVRVSLSVMSRVLHRIGARRGRPKPVVKCRLSDRQKRRRLSEIRKLIEQLPPDEVVVYEDEVDIHLNPKIGLDWMARGEQKQVVTPGNNEKAYIAGALDINDGRIIWVGGIQKNSQLFIALLERLQQSYPNARRIHVVLDNYGIHSSSATLLALKRLPRIELHFLPPYCPDHNRIERLWLDLHANVTRNHRCGTLQELCEAVASWLNAASPWPSRLRERDTEPEPASAEIDQAA